MKDKLVRVGWRIYSLQEKKIKQWAKKQEISESQFIRNLIVATKYD